MRKVVAIAAVWSAALALVACWVLLFWFCVFNGKV